MTNSLVISELNYIKGDCTSPVGEGTKIIVHVCNDIGAWGAGFTGALSKKWKEPEEAYRSINVRDLTLGSVTIVQVQDDIWVANMIAQHGTISKPLSEGPPIRYAAVRAALANVNDVAYKTQATIHMPRIGCGLAGGKWEEIEKIIKDVMSVNFYVYDL